MKRASRRIAWFAAVAALLGGCAEPLVQVRDVGAGRGQPLALQKIAIAPFRAAPRAGAPALPSGAAELVAGYVADALGARGVATIPASDVAQVMGGDTGADPRSVPQLVRSEFGADAVVIGTVYRFRDRSGEALGSTRPASVGFEVKIFATETNKLLWAGVFDHTQVALSENALTATRYPGGGTRWMTADELGRWGASQMVAAIPLP
jgi:hypothetical protein